MVTVFLQTEIASSRFRPTLLELLRRDGRDPRLVEHPDLADADENAYRRHLLTTYRGFQRNADVFTAMPAEVRWSRALITPDELARVRYLNDDYWIVLSGGSRLAADAATRIRQGIEAFGVGNGGFWFLADALAAGAVFPELILVGAEEHAPLVVLSSLA